MASEGSRKRRARNVPARMAEYISDFVVEETPSKIPSSSSSNDHSHSNTSHILPLPPHSSAKPVPTSPLIPEEKDNCNHDLCDNCGDGGDLICCDRCPASFHLLCVEPPLHNNTVPEGDWFCKQCTTLINPPKLPKNPIAASLLRQLSNMNPRIFTLPKEIFEVAKKGKGFSEEGRQMGSGTTATDVFGNSILLGTCSVCTVEGKQESLIACSACKTLYHTYCVDPVLVNKPAGFWICPNHDADSLPLPPGVSRVLKGHNTTHLLPSGSVRLDFVPSPYSEYGSSDDSGSDDSDDDDSSGSGDGSDSSDNEGGHSAPFRAMVRSIRKAAASGGNNSRRDNRRRGSFDSYTYLDDFYDDEVYEEIDLFTPPEDQTRLLLNLGRPQRLRFNNNSNDNALLGQNKQQLDSLLAQQRLLAQAAMPATDLFGNPLPTPTSPASILSNSIPSTPQTSNTASSTTATTDENNESEKTSSPMDTSTDTSSTPATTTSTDTTNSGTPNTTTTPQVPMDSIFGTGLGCSPLALAQLTPLFTQFLAWQRLMQVNQQIQQHQAGNAVYLQQQQQQQPQLSTEQQVQQIQQQRAQLRNYYESFQNQQPYRPPSLYNQHSSDYMDIDAGAHLTHRFSRSHLRPGPPTVPSQPRVPLRAKSPHAKPFPQSRWVRDKSSVRPPSARPPPPPSLKLAASYSTPHTPSQPSSVQTTPSAVQFSNHPSIYSKPTTPYQTTPKSSPFTTPTPNTQTSPTSSDAGTPTDPPSGSIKSKYVRKRKPAVESPPSPKKTPREGSDGDKDDEGDGKESADKKSKRDNAIKLRGKGGRFVHKDPVLAAQAAAQAAMTAIVKAKKGSGPKKDKDGEKEKEAKEQESTKEDILKSPKIEATKGDKAKGEAESPNKVKDVEMKTEEQSEGKEDKKDTNQDFDTFVCLDINMEDTKATATVEANGEVERTEEERKKAEEEKKKVEEKAPKRSQRQIEKGEKKKLQEADKESDQEEEKKPKRREKKKKEDAEEEVTGKKRKLSRTKKPETRKKKKETLEEEIQPPPRTSDTVFEGKVENSANNTNNNDNKSTITITTNKPNNNVSLNNNTTTTTTTAAKPITPNKPTTTTPSTTPTTTTTAATTTKTTTTPTTTPISKPPTITTTPVTTPTTTPISKPPTPIPATSSTPATPVTHTTNITNTNNTTPTNTTTTNVRHVSSYFSNATTYTPNSTNSTSTPTTNNDNNNNSITREGSSTTLATSTSSSSSSKPMIVIEEARMKSLDTIQEKVKYNKPILGKLVVTVVDPFVEEENLPKPITYEIRKPVVSIGRTRINKIPGEPDIIDVDTSDFGANARPVSHLHAYLVFCPSSYDPTLPGEVSLWILGRNYTKVDGVQHKGGIVALTNNSVFKVSKVKFEFTQLI